MLEHQRHLAFGAKDMVDLIIISVINPRMNTLWIKK